MEQTLAPKITVAEIVEAYIKAKNLIKDAYKILGQADEALQIFGIQNIHYRVIPKGIYGTVDEVKYDILEQLHRDAWERVIKLGEVEKMLSQERKAKMREHLEKGELPELNLEEAINMLKTLLDNSSDFVREAALEVHDFLTPARTDNQHWGAQYKTNRKNGRTDIGKKVILVNKMETVWSNWGFRHTREQDFRNMDRVFHALDGNLRELKNAYHSPLVDKIQTTPREISEIETNYFHVKLYNNGNVHLTFKRMDLVQKLNAICADGSLKG